MVMKQAFVHRNSKENINSIIQNIYQPDWKTQKPVMEDDKEKNDPTSIRRTLYDLASQSNVHGISFLVGNKSLPIKVIWAAAFLGLFGFATYQLYTIMTLYYSYPVQTKVKVEFKPLPFPAVTICNMNTIRKSKVHTIKNSAIQKIVNGTYDDWASWYMPSTTYQSTTTTSQSQSTTTTSQSQSTTTTSQSQSTTTTSATKTSVSMTDGSGSGWNDYPTTPWYDDGFGSGYDSLYYYDPYEYITDPYTSPLSETKQYEKFKQEYLTIDREQKQYVGHQLKDMLMNCMYNGRPCNGEKKNVVTYEYGNCFTIQSPTFISGSTGPRSGMVLTINLENHEAIEELTEGYGMRLVIHEPNSFPLPMEEGMTISGGYETSIGLKMSRIERKGEPYGRCIEPFEYFKKNHMRYSTQVCIQQCWESLTLAWCDCDIGLVQSEVFRFHDQPENVTRTIKGCFTKEDRECATVARIDLLKDIDKYCNCPQPCLENTYSTTFSGRIWPHDTKLNELTEQACNNYNLTEYEYCELAGNMAIARNFLKVNIYFSDLNYEIISEEPLYDDTQLISDVGGSMGLCLGASLLCMCEIFEVILMLVLVIGRKVRGKTAVHGIHLTQEENTKQ